ncbi:diaminopimelate epimerase [Blattabacterium cuenoti]|uniref:diaminopimelate epimerase n=1 Tax=Blattabacterium cuenoti TaxID=1653831 RepID=UPI00163BF9B9|nr:diaminopimelate epimerase [Blattabacterium cuenoti]
MKLDFFKYQGTGNDFILIDSREQIVKEDPFLFKKLCDRHFGIGSDGIILIQNDSKSDFYMKYYNSDGKESTMCGNGGRCAIFFAKTLEIPKKRINQTYFRAIDGFHYGFIKRERVVSINLIDIKKDIIEIYPKHVFLNTGSPHHIVFIKKVNKINVYQEGRKIRFQNSYLKEGVNVNFVEIVDKNILQVRTYERGVEKETLSCGTGVTASVIAACETNKISNSDQKEILVNTLGGKLFVSFIKTSNEYKNIYLTGSVGFIFRGCVFI